MEIIAKSKHLRLSPRKLRLVADLIRGLSLNEALDVLGTLNQRAAHPILLTLKQGIGNAVNNFDLLKDSLKIKEIQVQEAPTLKRWRAASRGRAHRLQKRTSHLQITLSGQKSQEKPKTLPKEKSASGRKKPAKKPSPQAERKKHGSKS